MNAMRRLLPVVLIAGSAVPAGAAAPALSAPTWTAKMTVPTHTPKARERWPVKIVVKTASGRPLSGTVQYHFLYGGQVVQTRSCLDNGNTPCPFNHGVYRDVLHWPMRSVGIKLTFQATVKTKLGTKNKNYWVKVRR
jgi:hypothetical protein